MPQNWDESFAGGREIILWPEYKLFLEFSETLSGFYLEKSKAINSDENSQKFHVDVLIGAYAGLLVQNPRLRSSVNCGHEVERLQVKATLR